MKKVLLQYQTPVEWVEKVYENFPLFLADHAANERKAAASCMLLVVQYPDQLSLVQTAARIAEEEIGHFRQVFLKMKRLGYALRPDEKDVYVGELIKHVRNPSSERFLDRLIVNSIIEIRGMERFEVLSKHFPESSWRQFYEELGESEKGHGLAFIKEAKKIFPEAEVEKRISEWILIEADAFQITPVTYRFH